ncbi:MAG: MerR family transcriptional regulator [Nitrospinota bacterium]|jgi:MerR family transcriptional regulator/heat shock protein HspR|nr:MerR family transcriptional regulator [Nitrospinota bacterium]MDP7166812.1 MerR family transcriptional regulator [Nitrospinota bacterium]MDP7370807.1 MerR family transcriptional regulator [Nitrospinota bacterium]MDP7503466.1 MerR family transcriptional regulator [Nitrospinota bacterium]MDP7665044.1 MerR family transcriptional regulator [Nitrospinota bacterium]|tara:strand:+ start:244 stop:654 length:411 start_codon:yes stop_codon:yes gene_type:complete
MARRVQRKDGKYTISVVAEMFDVHPQTLRMYEREGLLEPGRSEGKTRLYSDEDLERVEMILTLTREMGVNLAGVEVIIDLRAKLVLAVERLTEFEEIFRSDVMQELRDQLRYVSPDKGAMIPLRSAKLVRMKRRAN